MGAFIAMRLVEGTDLRTLLAHEGVLDPARALAIAAQTASALDAAHARGLLHRDVKPGNILLVSNEADLHVYLSDFGIAVRHGDFLGSGAFQGTAAYAAPEQIEGKAESREATSTRSLACSSNASPAARRSSRGVFCSSSGRSSQTMRQLHRSSIPTCRWSWTS